MGLSAASNGMMQFDQRLLKDLRLKQNLISQIVSNGNWKQPLMALNKTSYWSKTCNSDGYILFVDA